MRLDTQLPPIFTDSNICRLEAYGHSTTRTPPRTVGSSWFSTRLSAMTGSRLDLRLDGAVYSFLEARNTVSYGGRDLVPAVALKSCDPPRVIAIRRITTRRALTLLLVDELLDKAVAVIGDTLAWHLEGLDVRFTTINDETIYKL